MAATTARDWLRAYYYLTPLFFLGDTLLGLDFRVAGLHASGHRFAYYGGCMLCALLLRYRPPLAPLVGMAESSVNLAILMAGVLLPLLQPDLIEAGGYTGLHGAHIINFLLSGGILLATFYSAQHRLLQK